jgi:hypothetical protein
MRRTGGRADTSGVGFEAFRARLQQGEYRPSVSKASVAPLLELLPLVPFVAQFSFLTAPDALTPLWPLGIAAGLGWVLIGRWRTGLGYAVVRLAVLYAGFIVLVYVSLSDLCDAADPRCIDTGSTLHSFATPLLWTLCAFYAATALGSAYLLNRSISKQRDGPADGALSPTIQ